MAPLLCQIEDRVMILASGAPLMKQLGKESCSRITIEHKSIGTYKWQDELGQWCQQFWAYLQFLFCNHITLILLVQVHFCYKMGFSYQESILQKKLLVRWLFWFHVIILIINSHLSNNGINNWVMAKWARWLYPQWNSWPSAVLFKGTHWMLALFINKCTRCSLSRILVVKSRTLWMLKSNREIEFSREG